MKRKIGILILLFTLSFGNHVKSELVSHKSMKMEARYDENTSGSGGFEIFGIEMPFGFTFDYVIQKDLVGHDYFCDFWLFAKCETDNQIYVPVKPE